MSAQLGDFIVVREHSHTDKQYTMKVMSRPFSDQHRAEMWMGYCRDVDEPAPDRNYYVVQVVAMDAAKK